MILQALNEYYNRLLNEPDINVSIFGFEQKAVDFVVVLAEDGTFANLLDFRQGVGAKRKGRISSVPKSVKRSSGVNANLLWDTRIYVLGYATRDEKKSKLKYDMIVGNKIINLSKSKENLRKFNNRTRMQHEAFIQKIKSSFVDTKIKSISAVLKFLKDKNFNALFNHSTWQEVAGSTGNISFMIDGRTQLVCQEPDVVKIITQTSIPEGDTLICSITGKQDVPIRLHSSIKGVWGAQSSGADIVSFNMKPFCSFQKKQGFNVPIGEEAGFGYTTALNYLLGSDVQRMQVGDSSTVFWAKEPCDFEAVFCSILSPKKGEEAVSYDKIRGLLSSVKTGVSPQEAEIPFYVLGLAPNAARISVRFWYEGNLKEMKERIAQHFEDLMLIHSPMDPEFVSLFQLLSSIALERKVENIPPNIAGELARSVFEGKVYPRTLLARAIQRNKSEQKVTFARASIIKAFLARNSRIINQQEREVSMSLDKEYKNIGYVLGRLFAVLEKIQQTAQTGINKTIRDTYFGAATSSPLTTFNRLNDLAIHHLSKIRNSGKNAIWLEKLMQEVYANIPAEGIPAILKMEDQGRFSIGYYHQRQDFFKTKDNKENEGEEK
jgi:CRISPR-associated protein Csd1